MRIECKIRVRGKDYVWFQIMDPIQGQVSNQGFDSKLGFQIRVSNHGWTFEPGLVFQSGASSLGQGSRLQCKAKFRVSNNGFKPCYRV